MMFAGFRRHSFVSTLIQLILRWAKLGLHLAKGKTQPEQLNDPRYGQMPEGVGVFECDQQGSPLTAH